MGIDRSNHRLVGRFVTTVVIRTLEGEGLGSTFLLRSECLEKVNYYTISIRFDTSMHFLRPGTIKDDGVILFLNNSAPCMVTAGISPNTFY